MKIFNAKVLLYAAAVVAIGAGTTLAHADVSGMNNTTGANSVNKNTVKISDYTSLSWWNHLDVNNKVHASANTGHNYFSNNTKIGDIVGGSILGTINLATSSDPSGPWFDWDGIGGLGDVSVNFGNGITGANSINKNSADISSKTKVKISNDTDVNNQVCLNLNTGYNKISHNTVVGNVGSGDAAFNVSITNPSSSNWALGNISLPQPGSVSANFGNSLTGSHSENTNKLTTNSSTSLSVSNHTDTNNNISVSADSGHNSVGGNTVVGDVSTGSISIGVDVQN